MNEFDKKGQVQKSSQITVFVPRKLKAGCTTAANKKKDSKKLTDWVQEALEEKLLRDNPDIADWAVNLDDF